MIIEYFNKIPLQNINPDEVVAQGAVLAAYLDVNIHDITSKAIGIEIQKGIMDIFIPVGTVLPQKNAQLLQYQKNYYIQGESELININIYEGNCEDVSKNELIGKFSINLGKDKEKKEITISMILDYNSILKVSAILNNGNKVNIKLKYNQ